MKPWIRYSLYALGGLAGLWVLYRAFLRPRETVEVEGEGDIVPLLTPSAGTPLGGVSNFPSAPGTTQAFTAIDLWKLERSADIEDRDYAAAQQASRRAATAAKSAEDRKRADAKSAEDRKRADDKAAAAATTATRRQQDNIMTKVWDEINTARIKAGKPPLVVCIRGNGAIGVGGDQCKNAIRRFGA